MAGLCAASAEPEAAGSGHALWAAVGPSTKVPFGWVDFCRRYAEDCAGDELAPEDVVLTPASRQTLESVNTEVNQLIAPVSDAEHWGKTDQWDYPMDGRGDCEDYALLKRRILIEAGFPRQALLITVVRDQQAEGHAILTARTDRGDFVLDNLSDRVRLWSETGYRFVKRQSQANQNVWVSLGDPGPSPIYTAR